MEIYALLDLLDRAHQENGAGGLSDLTQQLLVLLGSKVLEYGHVVAVDAGFVPL